MNLWQKCSTYYFKNMGCKCLMKWRSSCTACTCRHQGVARGQLQKSEVPDWLTGTASVTADHSDAAKRHLLDNYSRIVFAHTWCLAVMAKGDVFAVHRIRGGELSPTRIVLHHAWSIQHFLTQGHNFKISRQVITRSSAIADRPRDAGL